MTILTTHYDYLTKLEKGGKFNNYCFDVELTDNKIICDYKIRKGKSSKGIALELLKMKGFDDEMSQDANNAYNDIKK